MDAGKVTDLLLRHYAVAGPYMERIFGAIPFTWTTLPAGVRGPKIYHGPLSEKTRPKGPVVDVPMTHGVRRYPALSAQRIEGLVRHGAVEFYSWAPTIGDPTRARFGRILLETKPETDRETLDHAIRDVEEILGETKSLRVYDGGIGAALWIPFCDAPDYDDVRVWLHGQCLKVAERYPAVVTLEPNARGGPPVHLHVQSNAVGRFSVLPYSVRALGGYPVAIPVVRADVDATNFAEWIEKYGEAFARQPEAFWNQRFEDREDAAPRHVRTSSLGRAMPAQKSHGPIVNAAIAVLQDGRAHAADDILALAVHRGLLEATVSVKYVYTSLIEYIARANGNGRKPAIVQNANRTFRINEPPDEWPVVPDEPAATVAQAIAALIERLDATASAGQSADFEQAVCDAFDALGFAATHVGGQKAPDGYADALLGALSYRTMIECKSAGEGVNDPDVFEAAKFRDAFGADFCALVARAFSGEIELAKELQNHGVSAWTVEDLQTLLRIGANPLELKPLFAPGFASDGLDDLLWERRHGRAKRVRLIAEVIVKTGGQTQSAYRGAPAEAPRITEDVAMVFVNQDLAAQGSAATCSRDDVRAAIDYLANPLVGLVVRDSGDGSVVVLGIDSLEMK